MMLRPMFVTGSLVHGGAERHSITVMNRLADRGHDCHAVYVKNDPSQLSRINRQEGDAVRCLHARRFLDFAAVDDFTRHISRVRPSVIVAANGYALMYASLAQQRSGLPIPIIVTFHTTQLFGIKEHFKMLIDRPFFWRATRAVFVCEMQKRYWLKRGVGSRSNMVIYNGVDTEYFRDRSSPDDRLALRQTAGFSGTDYVVGIPAVLRPEKNHLQLVDAVAELRSRGVPARVLMIGDGPLAGAVEIRRRTLGVEGDVHITGFQQEVRPFLAACDVIVLCSLSETFSLAALEGMAMGKPVVHSNVGGAAEMIFPGCNGYLFPPADTRSLVDRLAMLADRRVSIAMGADARALVEANFSETVMVDRYENALLDVCAHPAAARQAFSRNCPRNNGNTWGGSLTKE